MINVFAAAARCSGLVNDLAAWKSKAVTAMICRDAGRPGDRRPAGRVR